MVSVAQHDLAVVETVVVDVGLIVHDPLVSSVGVYQVNGLRTLFLDLDEVCVFFEGWIGGVLADLFPHCCPNGSHYGRACVVDEDVLHVVVLEGVDGVVDEETGESIAAVPVDLADQQSPQVLISSNLRGLTLDQLVSDRSKGKQDNGDDELSIHTDYKVKISTVSGV